MSVAPGFLILKILIATGAGMGFTSEWGISDVMGHVMIHIDDSGRTPTRQDLEAEMC